MANDKLKQAVMGAIGVLGLAAVLTIPYGGISIYFLLPAALAVVLYYLAYLRLETDPNTAKITSGAVAVIVALGMLAQLPYLGTAYSTLALFDLLMDAAIVASLAFVFLQLHRAQGGGPITLSGLFSPGTSSPFRRALLLRPTGARRRRRATTPSSS